MKNIFVGNLSFTEKCDSATVNEARPKADRGSGGGSPDNGGGGFGGQHRNNGY